MIRGLVSYQVMGRMLEGIPGSLCRGWVAMSTRITLYRILEGCRDFRRFRSAVFIMMRRMLLLHEYIFWMYFVSLLIFKLSLGKFSTNILFNENLINIYLL